MYYPDELVEEIRTRNDIVDVISSYIRLTKKGSNYFGLCPFHSEKSPSFSVSPSKQIYYCFGCESGGNVIRFVQNYENYTFPEALKALADRAGIELPEITYSEENKKQKDMKTRLLELNKEAGKFYYYQLRNRGGEVAMKYLTGRGLSQETIQKFGLGYAMSGQGLLYRYLKDKGFEDEILKQSGIFTFDEKRGVTDKFWSRVIFPIMDANHRIIGFGGRTMGDGKPKYLNSPETAVFDKGRNLYGLNLARTSRKKNFILCEGYMDVISLHQAGFNQAVASLGTALTEGQARLLKRYTEEILLTYDNDDAGINAKLRAIPILRNAGLASKIIDLSPYKDPDEFIKNLGTEEFEKRIEEAENSFYYIVRMLERKYNIKDPSDKTRFADDVAEKLLMFTDGIERDNYTEGVAELYHMDPSALKKLVNKHAMKAEGITIREPVKSGIRSKNKDSDDGIKKAQRMLLTWFIEQPGIYELAKKYISENDFAEGIYREVSGLLFKQLEEGRIDAASILDKFPEEDEQSEVARIFNTPLNYTETAQEMERALKELLINVRTNSINNLTGENADDEITRMIKLKQETEQIRKLHFPINV